MNQENFAVNINNYKETVENYLKNIFNDVICQNCYFEADSNNASQNHETVLDPRSILKEAMIYSLTAKSKRVRPLLVVLVFLLFEKETELYKILPLAGAIEIIHTYSLIHDDLPSMDNDDFRRGQLTCHKKFGEDMAILAGDTLNTFAFELISKELIKSFPAEKVLQVVLELSKALGICGMAGGQVLDLRSELGPRDEAYLTKTHHLKTGALLKVCFTLPGILAGASEEELAKLADLGETIGLLFQIKDDILDVVQEKNILGKSAKKDLAQNKLTYVTLLGLEKAREKAESEDQKAKKILAELSYLEIKQLAYFLEQLYLRKF
ncbi:MAG: polyprenyl synthetase family protein [Candidatus Margulisiibacteriota bacterium]|jgi:geranylgeranyl diphosphate synthase type II